MEFFQFSSDSLSPDFFERGSFINGIKKAMWVERFRDPGEFTFSANVSSNLRETLPIGAYISHVDTYEVMMVENHEIDEDVEEAEPQIVISGRSLDAWLEQRVVGQDIEHYSGLVVNYEPYALVFETSWEQSKELIRLHINDPFYDPLEVAVGGIVPISNQQHIGSSTTDARIINPSTVHAALLELLAIDDFGIRTVRPNPDNDDPTVTEFRIHNGADRTNSVVFSHAAGDLQKAKYLWSNKSLKTDYYCFSTYLAVRSHSTAAGLNRRVLLVDCTDIDQQFSIEDMGGEDVGFVGPAMYARGEQLLKNQIFKSILSTNVSTNSRYQFRKDYEVGDLVRVNGNYDTNSIMRVTEHVEFLDESGESGYPTLSAYNPVEE